MNIVKKIKSVIRSCETHAQIEVCEDWIKRAIDDFPTRIHLFRACERQGHKIFKYPPVQKISKRREPLYINH